MTFHRHIGFVSVCLQLFKSSIVLQPLIGHSSCNKEDSMKKLFEQLKKLFAYDTKPTDKVDKLVWTDCIDCGQSYQTNKIRKCPYCENKERAK